MRIWVENGLSSYRSVEDGTVLMVSRRNVQHKTRNKTCKSSGSGECIFTFSDLHAEVWT